MEIHKNTKLQFRSDKGDSHSNYAAYYFVLEVSKVFRIFCRRSFREKAYAQALFTPLHS